MKKTASFSLLLLGLGSFVSGGPLSTEQFYRTYNIADVDGDGVPGGSTTSTTVVEPTMRNQLPADALDGNPVFFPGNVDPDTPGDNLDNNLDGDIDGSSPSAPVLSIFDSAVEIPGNLIDDNGDFAVDETPSPTASIGENFVLTVAPGDDVKLGFRAPGAFTTLQAFPTGAQLDGGFDANVASNSPDFSDFYGNIEWTAGDPGLWLFRLIAFNGAGIDTKEFMVRVLPPFTPDAMIGTSPGGGIGDDIYNAIGAQQTLNLVSRRAKRKTAHYTLQNDGADDDTISVRSTKGNRFFKVIYTSPVGGNVTAQVVSGIFQTALLGNGNSETLTTRIIPKKKKLKKKRKNGRVKWKKKTYTQRLNATSVGDNSQTDTNILRVKHR